MLVVLARIGRGPGDRLELGRAGRGAVLLADRGDLRVGEDDARNGAVVRGDVAAEDVGGRDPALVFADVGERPDPGDVADRPDAFGGAHPLIDLDPLGGAIRIDPGRVEAEAVDPRLAPGRDQQLVPAELGAVLEGERVALPAPIRRARLDPESQLDSLRAQGLVSASPRAGASFGSRRSSPSAIATDAPRRERAWPSSTPTGPPPRTIRRCGISVSAVASRLVQTSSSSSQSVDRRDEGVGAGRDDQPARFRAACRRSRPRPAPLMRASPRRSSTPVSVSLPAWWESSQSETWKFRQASASLR